jgi:predicted metal-dependent hydrolase
MHNLVQLALDFLAPAPPVAPPQNKKNKRNRPPALVPKGVEAPDVIAKSEPPQSPEWAAPAVFRHPQARRELRLGNALVGYALVRARRRSIGFSVAEEGLSVRAPHAVTLGAIDAALQGKADWILRKLVEARERAARVHAARIVWQDGVCLPWLGGALCVRLDGTAPVAGRLVAAPGGQGSLHLGLPAHASAAQLRDAAAAWVARAARAHFTERLEHFAPRMGVRWRRLALTNARTRWGSARSDGSIRLNWRLMHFAPDVLDYVVVHELAHLRVMDHSPRFWAEVEAVLPDYAALRRRLHQEAAPPWEN